MESSPSCSSLDSPQRVLALVTTLTSSCAIQRIRAAPTGNDHNGVLALMWKHTPAPSTTALFVKPSGRESNAGFSRRHPDQWCLPVLDDHVFYFSPSRWPGQSGNRGYLDPRNVEQRPPRRILYFLEHGLFLSPPRRPRRVFPGNSHSPRMAIVSAGVNLRTPIRHRRLALPGSPRNGM